MCLAIPGKIIEITDNDTIMRTGKVSFGGVVKDINLAYVPEAGGDDYVIVHAGFALSKLDEKEANEVFAYLKEIGDLEELNEP
jgi:hydrogenase expression/formation protein HypC